MWCQVYESSGRRMTCGCALALQWKSLPFVSLTQMMTYIVWATPPAWIFKFQLFCSWSFILSVVVPLATHWIFHSGDIREEINSPPCPPLDLEISQFTQSPAEDNRSQELEESEGCLLKMILLAALLVSQCCVSGSAAARGNATGLKRIEDCGTSCSQVKQQPDRDDLTLASTLQKHDTGLSHFLLWWRWYPLAAGLVG